VKLSDYVVDFLARRGIRHSFLVSGGAVIHLVDSVAKHPHMMPVCVQHEESGAAAADAYSRVTRRLGLVMTTSGPGATNIVTSVCNAYFDSIPMICLTGQVARFRIKKSKALRQRGFQETDVVSLFESITKYATLVTDPLMIRYELEKAIHLAMEGRPGPVVLDIPDDLQREEIDPDKLVSYCPVSRSPTAPAAQATLLERMISAATRPVMIFGAGIRCAQAEEAAVAFARRHSVPVLCTWGGADLLPHDDPLNMGCIGVCGPRGGNFAVQHADLVIALGTRLSPMITGGKQNLFAPHAKKVMVDIDPEELSKFGPDTFMLDLPILSDLRAFLTLFPSAALEDRHFHWRETIRSWIRRYPLCSEEDYKRPGRVNPYVFIKELSRIVPEDAIIIGDTGANISWTMQAFATKRGQQIFSAWNHTPMGYSLPASIGAALATERTVVCLIGDGGLMMCLQELATMRRHDLPIKLFLFDNQGHGIQKQTIDTWLQSHYVAVDEPTGLYFPDYRKIAEAFRLPYYCIRSHADLPLLDRLAQESGPFLCSVEIVENHKIVPMLKFGAGLDDLDPKLPPAELAAIAESVHQGALL
jgi:acetolactate synthase-1/2/3 large subunit